MADTIRARTDLLTALADNATGQISAQDMRDVLVSVHGVYGMLHVEDASTPQTGLNGTPQKLTAFVVEGPSSGVTCDATNDKLTVGTAGVYLCMLQLSFSGTISASIEGHIYKGGVDTGLGFHRKMGTGGDQGSASCIGLVTCAASDVLEIYVTSDGSNDSVTVIDGQFAVVRVA